MRKVISVSLDSKLESDLEKNAKALKVSRSEVVQRALKQYLYLSQAALLRRKNRPYAEKAGYYSEEDIYRDIS